MCSNYQIPKALQPYFAAHPITFETRPDVYPGYAAPVLLADARDPDMLEPVRATFGMLPHWAKDARLARQTYNARSETVHAKPSFRDAWRRRQLCLVPVQAFYEPCYESGKPVRWQIRRRDEAPFALAGIWETRPAFDDPGQKLRSFSMLTISGAGHPIMQRMHAPDDEKRSVVVVPPSHYQTWLQAPNDEAARALLLPFDAAEFVAEPAPRAAKVLGV
jgi:putative SOS response-associated peptidase YedK